MHSLLLVIGPALWTPAGAPPDDAVVKVTWKSCAGASTIVTDANACYVMDLKTGKKTLTYELCAGVNFSNSVLGFGGKAKSLLCATVEVPVGTSEAAARKAAEEALRKELDRARRSGALPKDADVKSIGSFTLKNGPAPKALKDAYSK